MTVTLGWWMIPTAATAALTIWLFLPEPAPRGWGSIGDGLVTIVQSLCGLVIVLAMWLAWAVLA